MHTVNTDGPERARLTQANDIDSTDEESHHASSQPPGQRLLHSSAQGGQPLTPLKSPSPLLISGLYGYGFGIGLAALWDRSDVWSIPTGVVWLSIATACIYRGIQDAPKNEGQIDKPYIVKNGAMIALCAVSACVVNWENFC